MVTHELPVLVARCQLLYLWIVDLSLQVFHGVGVDGENPST
jgi:hypothetical protein